MLPISNPANLVVYAAHMPPLGQWMMRFARAVDPVDRRDLRRAALHATLAFARKHRGRRQGIEAVDRRKGGSARHLRHSHRAHRSPSALDIQLGLPTFIAGLTTVIVVLAINREGPLQTVKGISWVVLPLVAGLFVLVEALVTTGVLALLARTLKEAASRSDIMAGAIGGMLLAFGSNLVNNLPAGLLAGAAVQSAHASDKVAGAILVGVDLGPNLSVTGSLATILWLTAIRREGEDVSFWTFLKIGLVAMPPALIAALAALLLLP